MVVFQVVRLVLGKVCCSKVMDTQKEHLPLHLNGYNTAKQEYNRLTKCLVVVLKRTKYRFQKANLYVTQVFKCNLGKNCFGALNDAASTWEICLVVVHHIILTSAVLYQRRRSCLT